MKKAYVHGYNQRENIRLQDQASTLVELLHSDTIYPAGSRILEAGCGVGAQTTTLAKNSPGALITSIDISEHLSVKPERKLKPQVLRMLLLNRQIFLICLMNLNHLTTFLFVLFWNICRSR